MGEIQFTSPRTEATRLADVLRALYERLERSDLALKRMDRVEFTEALTTQLGDRGVHILVPSTTNTDIEGRGACAWVDDELSVYTAHRINPKDQTESHYAALGVEEQVRAALCSRSEWFARWDITYRGTPARGPSTNSAEWYVIQQAFRLRRFTLTGG